MSAIDQKEDWLLARQSGIGGTKVERELEGGMTSEEALLEARRRWGDYAFAVEVFEEDYEVGKTSPPPIKDMVISTYGRGDSWEAAFADADRKENGR